MKNTIAFLILFSTNICLAQMSMPIPADFCTISGATPTYTPSSVTSSTNGWVHTPKGNLHILIIFVADGSAVPPSTYGIGSDPAYSSSNIYHWSPSLIPNWAMGPANYLLDETSSTIGTHKNLSLFYREMSHGQFVLTGEIFPELIPTANGYATEAVAYINSNYPNFDWSRFDNRTNHPNYNSDNSVSSPDGIIDYVVFLKRRNGFSGFSDVEGSHTLTTNYSGIPVDYLIRDGHRAEFCYNSASHHQIFFKHEFSHNLYLSSHYLGSNSKSDGKYYYQNAGWGLMAGWHQQFDVANAWESWWLGWITAQEVTATGTHQIQDYVTTGDAIRIPIPNTNGEYLWIENHQKTDLHGFDNKPYYLPSTSLPDAEDIDPGLYMYVTKHFGDQGDPSLMRGTSLDATNFIKLINAEGNFDIVWDQQPKLSVPGIGLVPVFDKTAENPIAGQNTWSLVKYDKDGNGAIDVSYCHGNLGCSPSEEEAVVAEVVSGVRKPTYARTGKHGQAFVLGSELGLSGKMPIINYPTFDNPNDKMTPYILNGLSIKVTNYNSSTGEYTLTIDFSDHQVRNNKRWCGNIELPPNQTPSAPALEVVSGVTLTVDKSGTPNKRNEIISGGRDFINPTILNCLPDAYIKLQSNSILVIDNQSTLKLSANSKIDVNSGAILRVRQGSSLVLESGANINVLDGGKVIIENDGRIEYFQNAGVKLTGPNAELAIAGILDIKDDATFTFSYDNNNPGFVRFNNTTLFPSRNIIGGNNTSINLNGINQTRKILAIDQETLYGPSSLVNFVINNGRVEFNAGSRLQFDGLQTNINLNNSRFTSNIFGTYNEHRGVYIYGQPNVTIENCIFEYGRYGIYGWLSYGGAPLTITNSVFRHNDWAIRSFDKGLNTFNCHFQNNNVAVSAISMSFPSFFFEGAVGGSVSVKNNFGINWNSYSTGSLTLDDPYINTNLYSGVRINPDNSLELTIHRQLAYPS